MSIRNRVKELRHVRASTLTPSPRNWRTHGPEQKAALEAVLSEVGIAGAILCRELPGGPLEIIDGHLRQETLPDEIVPVLVLDVTSEEADKLLLSYDPIAAMAGADAARLGELLQEVSTASPALQALLDGLASQAGVAGADGELKPVAVAAPPSMTWVLLGIPTVRYGEVAAQIEQLAAVEGMLCEITVNADEPDGPEPKED